MNTIQYHHWHTIVEDSDYNFIREDILDNNKFSETELFNTIFLKKLAAFANGDSYTSYNNICRHSYGETKERLTKSIFYNYLIEVLMKTMFTRNDLYEIQIAIELIDKFIDLNFKDSIKFNKLGILEYDIKFNKMYSYICTKARTVYDKDKLVVAFSDYVKYYDESDKYSYKDSIPIFELIDENKFKKDMNKFILSLNKSYLYALNAPMNLIKKSIKKYIGEYVYTISKKAIPELKESDLNKVTFYYACDYNGSPFYLASNRLGTLYANDDLKDINDAIHIDTVLNNNIDSKYIHDEFTWFTYIVLFTFLKETTSNIDYIKRNIDISSKDDFSFIYNIKKNGIHYFSEFINGFSGLCSPFVSVENTKKNFILLPRQLRGDFIKIIYASDPNRKNIRKSYKYESVKSNEIVDSNFNSQSTILDENDRDRYGAQYFGDADAFLAELSFMEGESLKNKYAKLIAYNYKNDEIEFDYNLDYVNFMGNKLLVTKNF